MQRGKRDQMQSSTSTQHGMLQSTTADVLQSNWIDQDFDLGLNVPNLPLSPENINLGIQEDCNSNNAGRSSTSNDFVQNTVDLAPKITDIRSVPSRISVPGEIPTSNSTNINRVNGTGANRATLAQTATETEISTSLNNIRQQMNVLLGQIPKTGTVVNNATTQSGTSDRHASALSSMESTQNLTTAAQTAGSSTTVQTTPGSNDAGHVLDVPVLSLHDQGLVTQGRPQKGMTDQQPTKAAAMGSRGKKRKSKEAELSSKAQATTNKRSARTQTYLDDSEKDADNETSSNKSNDESSEAESSDESTSDENPEIHVNPKASRRIAAKAGKKKQSKQATKKPISGAKPKANRQARRTTAHASTPEKRRTNAQRKTRS